MDTHTKRPTGLPVLTAVVSVVAALLVFLAGPASAERSGTARADDSSVASGTARAEDNSVASGAARAEDNSVASGGAAPVDKDKDKDKEPDHKKPHVVHKGGGRLPTAAPAQARQVERLAFTGPRVGPELALATALVLAGAALMAAGAERRRPARASSS